MTLREPFPLENIGAVYNARDYRALFKRLFADRPGIFSPTDLAVTQQAVPAMGVTVAAGGGIVDAAGAGLDGLYFVDNDAAVNVALAAADAVNPRRDIIGIRVRDSESAGVDNDGAIVAITGVPAAVPVDPVLPSNFLVLARVAVAALAATIVNANITDLRRTTVGQGGLVTAAGGTIVCTSTTRPTVNLYEGVVIYETDTDRRYHYSGTAWVYDGGGTDPTAYHSWRNAAKALAVGAAQLIDFDTESYDYGANGAGGRYTAPSAGIYAAHARVSINGPAVNERFIAGLYVNVAEAVRGTDATAANGNRLTLEATTLGFPLAAGEVLDFRVNQINGVARNIDTGGELAYFDVRKVSN